MTEKLYRAFRCTFFSFALLAILMLGCTPKVLVEIPPRFDLRPYQALGIIEFSSNSTDQLNQFATQRFMSKVQAAQPGVPFLELGPVGQVLRSVNRAVIDPETIKSIGAKYNVNSIFTGTYEISEIKPELRIGEGLSSLHASATVKITLAVKHWDTKTGATIWTNSRYGKWSLAKVNKETGKPISFDLSAPADKYQNYMANLVHAVTEDFRTHYEKRAVSK
jgi:hypothetical protein